jgi:hypothetical protein
MPKYALSALALTITLQGFAPWAVSSGAQMQRPVYPAMASLDQYLLPDEKDEISLARSAAPASISNDAEVMVLRRDGYATVVEGSNGFVCIVERSWAKPTNDPEFWNPKVRAPTCFNRAASRTFLPIFLMKTRLALAGRSPANILAATDLAFRKKEFGALAPGAMCYMMASQQYLSDSDNNWHPHLMFFVSGDVSKSWGANLQGSPLIAADDPEERVTVFMMKTEQWSDGAAASSTRHPR